ncbi:MAG TPA: L,D-transpeptidase [Pyrinomonadaceae bacterium]|nr:L,D-transpeptidase [Pyrinomonadaceae bacterium]
MNFSGRNFIVIILLAISFGASVARAQKLASPYRSNESVRSDKYTGGTIERTELVAGEPDIEITVDVPAFRLTLWQNGKEVKTYAVGVGKKDFPISIGEKQASEIIWNPDWIPPNSEWVTGRKGIKAGEVIPASDRRNPLGKLKIPLGYGYLIHQAAAPTDLGNLVSHGCIRMLRTDLYDLAEKIVAARAVPVSPKQIANAKATKNTVIGKLDKPLMVDINYDTQVVEGGYLHLYPDVYERGTNTVEALRAELESSAVDASAVDDAMLKRMLARVNAKQKYVVSVESIASGRALADGRVLPLVGSPAAAKKKAAPKRRAA